MTILGRSWRAIALGLGALVVCAILLALLVALSGVYNVAASRGHPAWLNWFLEFGMRRSVATHSLGIASPPLESPDLIRLGAAHFHFGCGNCHGAPGLPGNPIYAEMLPRPPSLEQHAALWGNAELYWIVRHGIQYAGMPAWSGHGRDDEIWAVVAFLRRLPDLDVDGYDELAAGNITRPPYTADQLTRAGTTMLPLTACSRCHETAERAPTSALVPRLAVQTAPFLTAALEQYRAGTRESGFMEPVAADLTDAQIEALARYYAALDPVPSGPQDTPRGVDLERGRELAEKGDAAADLPPCDTCHGSVASPDYPRLAGQSAAYMIGQLELWRKGGRAATPYGRLMATIGARLSAEQIRDVSEYYETQRPRGVADPAESP